MIVGLLTVGESVKNGYRHRLATISSFLLSMPLSQLSGLLRKNKMSDFSTKNTKPTAAEYLAATESELLDRLNRNPSNKDSEFQFIQSVIAVRAAESQRKTNEDLVKQTRSLVFATWAICVVTLIAVFVSLKCK